MHVAPRPTYSTTHSRVSSTGMTHYVPVSSSKIMLSSPMSPSSQGCGLAGVVDPPMDCTEVEHYYDDDCVEYLDYVRRWEEQKDAETRAALNDPIRGERSLFFGLAKLQQQQWEAAVVACHNKQQSAKQLLGSGEAVDSLGHPASSAAGAAATAVELPGCSAILTPRCPSPTAVSVVVAPPVPHIAQSSMLAFMAELIAESNALATATASRVSSPIPATRTLAVATTHGLVSYPASVQGSPAVWHGHLRTYSNTMRHQLQLQVQQHREPPSAGGPQGSPHSGGGVMSLSPPSSDCITTTRKLRSNSMQSHTHQPIAAAS